MNLHAFINDIIKRFRAEYLIQRAFDGVFRNRFGDLPAVLEIFGRELAHIVFKQPDGSVYRAFHRIQP